MAHFDTFIREVHIDEQVAQMRGYPYELKAVKTFKPLVFHPKVTFFIGENGSGKSTLLEAIAVQYGFNPEGGTKNFNFSTEDTHSPLHRHLRITKGVRRPKTSFFLRAESFYNVASHIDALDKGGGGPPIIDAYGGVSLHKQSHGESFLSLMLNRFTGNGIYILDEPEAALSPNRLLALLRQIHVLTEAGAQFIIATHSPILLAYPEAIIYDIDHNYTCPIYTETEHFQVTKRFLNNPETILKTLFED